MQIKKEGYPKTVMVWAAIGNKFRHIVVHVDDDEGDVKAGVWADKAEMVKKEKLPHSLVDVTKRYTKKQLLGLTYQAQAQWLEIEYRWGRGKKSGVDSYDHCRRCLVPTANAVHGTHHLILEDNARIHTSNYSTLFKLNQKLNMLEGHPASSCDLNPCEHVWARLKDTVSFLGPPTVKDMASAIVKEFKAIPQGTVKKWMASYWSRLESCVERRGDWVGARECRVPRTWPSRLSQALVRSPCTS
jgi:transposase